MTEAPPRRSTSLEARPLVLTVVAVTVLGHVRALWNGFAWDDRHTVLANPALRSLAALLRSFGMDDWAGYGLRPRGLYRPLATCSLWLDRLVSGERPLGHHLTSVALHAAVAVMLFLLLRGAGVRDALALGAAALFGVHPLTAEVADWVSARPDGLSAALVVGALLAASSDRPIFAAVLAGLAAWAKEPALCAVPAVMVLAGARATRRQAVAATVIAAAGAGSYLVARHLASVPSNGAVARLVHPGAWPSLVRGAGEAAVGFGRAALTPLPLDATRRLPSLGGLGLAAGAAFVIAVAAGVVWSLRRRQPLAAAALLVGAIPLAMVGAYGVNLSERYLYLPLAATALLAGLVAETAVRQWPALAAPRPRRALAAAAVLLCVGAAIADVVRASEWGDPLALFESAARADPENPEAWQLYGAELYRAARRPDALAAFERSAALGSKQPGLYSNLCAVRRELGDIEKAAADCDRAVALDGEDPRPRYNRALLRAAAGHPEQAASDLRELLQRSPGYEPARRALGLAP